MFDGNYQTADYLFFLFNIGIIAGYLACICVLCSRRVIPLLSVILTRKTRVAGVSFFAAAGFTRSELAYRSVDQSPYLNLSNPDAVPVHVILTHLWQAFSLWLFMLLIAYDFYCFGREQRGERRS